MAAKDPQPPQTLKILCFGASLTAGWSKFGTQFHPYAEHLKLALQSVFPSTSIEIVVDGMSGAKVRSQYTGRLNRVCRERKGEPYDWIIIQGGTNDLGWGEKVEHIFEALRNVWNMALETGANVVALTVPECAVPNETLLKRRDELNRLIVEYEADRLFVSQMMNFLGNWLKFSALTECRRYHMDLCKAIPYFAMEEKRRDIIWDHDGLHLTAEGYDIMGDAIGARMAELLPGLQSVKNTQATI